MSGCVTVIGPPRAICSLNFGITLPDEPSTLPKRTAMKRVPGCSAASDDTTISAARLRGAHHVGRVDGLVGGDQHEALGAGLRATASAALCVPSVLLRTAAHALCSSISGTCL